MNKPITLLPIALTALAALVLTGCIRTTHEIKPIHITLDINLKVDRALDDFFGDIDQAPALPTETTETSNKESN